jgi:translation initiation factor 1
MLYWQNMRSENPTVYSTEKGRMCPKCGKAAAACTCKKAPTRPTGDGVVRIFRDAKGRKGKTVTLITGLAMNEGDLHSLLSDLKRRVGSGGALKDGAIEIQGDHREVIQAELKKLGYNAKLAGG